MTIHNNQVLRTFNGVYPAVEVDADIVCPRCGVPWRKGASYGHTICCGCLTCGYSYAVPPPDIYEILCKEEQIRSK